MKELEFIHDIDHRPYPLPEGPIALKQDWHDLLFAHWPVRAEIIREKVPPPLKVDCYDNFAWVGVVPFRMVNVQPVWSPVQSNFLELNVRTYVSLEGVGGVYFFSLDASDLLAVLAARGWYKLPYFFASMRFQQHRQRETQSIKFRSHRLLKFGNPLEAELALEYSPISEVRLCTRGSIEEFLTERYCLFNSSGGKTYRADIQHRQWPLQIAEAEITSNSMISAAGITVSEPRPKLLHFAREISTVAWALTRVSG